MTASLDPRLDAQSPLRLIVWVVGALVAVTVMLLSIALLLEVQLRELARTQSQMTASLMLDQASAQDALPDLLTELAALEGMLRVRILDREELASGVDGLLAEPDMLATLELPTMIEMQFAASKPVSASAVLERVRAVDPEGSVRDGSMDRTERHGDLLLFQRIALAALALAFAGIIGIVAITVHSALTSHHQTLDLLRTMGAEDRDLAHQFEAKTSGPLLISVLIGFLAGLAGAALLLITPLGQPFAQNDPLDRLQPLAVLAIVLLPALAGSAILLTIKFIASRYLRRMR